MRNQRNAVRSNPKTLYIVCEGQRTEPNYFLGLKTRDDVRRRFALTVESARGGDALAVVNHAINLLRRKRDPQIPNLQVWCVLDVEGQNSADILRQALQKAQQAGISVFLSNPCFEIWLVAHFERTNRPFHTAMDAKSYFSANHWRKLTGRGYTEADPQLYELLQDKIDTAVANSKHVLEILHDSPNCSQSNSSTEIYTPVERLLSS